MTGNGKGFIRVFNIDDKLVCDIIPVDYPINLMIAVAWHMGVNLRQGKND